MPSDTSVTIRLGWQPFPDAESVSPGLMLGRSRTRSPGFGVVLDVVEVPGVAVGVVGVVVGGALVVVGGVVVVVGLAGVVVVPGRVGGVVVAGRGGVVVAGGGDVGVGVAVTVNRLAALSGPPVRALVHVPVTG
ncbi:hypothetical protein [Amycolatopsis sp. DG1A-15b]|uniref:hypothetical protein n=1 Tax=Amycolatopsis sp. DG1A-15b TaxID=3052846 RepID=UPI00255B841C|nr:hypothetical protein [Amycolatopsis sp. DG1A-15b]WIX84983.1 hypothetical protein QRY02_27525 [Amycolatopsis sp. DG1A-15b]